jgi:hypothetical protein
MQQRRTAEEAAPSRTHRPLRQIVVYLCIIYGLTLAIALALPLAGITPSRVRVTATMVGMQLAGPIV